MNLEQSFSVSFRYTVFFSEHLFSKQNTLLADFLRSRSSKTTRQKISFILDEEVSKNHPKLLSQIDDYFTAYDPVLLIAEKLVIPGGEQAKNNESYFKKIADYISRNAVDRHSYIAAIGGGAVLDLAGYAAAVSHRGINLLRIPTTVLSQNDSGVGIKNGINYQGKKNFLGTFAPPVAVFNDVSFLTTLNDRHWLSGISEAVKVALIKDAEFFNWIEAHSHLLTARDMGSMNYLIKRCAELHVKHICGGDPFETGSSRPLDFGHWSAHKLEQLTAFEVFHGEAVAIGICLDSVYSMLSGRLTESACERIIQLFLKLGLPVIHPAILAEDDGGEILQGLEEFREHLGGQLTVMLLKEIGTGEEVHEMDRAMICAASKRLQKYLRQTI